MLQLKNNTPFAAEFAFFPNEKGVDTLYTLVKTSFSIGPQWTLLNEQLPLQKEDKYWIEANNSSLRFASDFHPGKAATDIIMIGSACSPQQQPVRAMDVSLTVANRQKTIRVFGNRVWQGGRISAPEAFTEMPLVYERAFGGSHRVDDKVQAVCDRNPVGTGFAGKRSESEMNGIALPNLECPQQLIQDYRDQPTPACFAPTAPHWQPRVSHAGSYDEKWQEERAPYLPDDYHPAFMNAAHPDLICDTFLTGGEPVSITGMHAMGALNFQLPQLKLINKLTVSGREVSTGFVLETLELDPNHLRLSMVWRAAFECDKKFLKINQINVSMIR
ncbi:MAG TPA: DUF2169 domain-containing protein [Cellvibrio sp.]|nr:DUF2169 domain-containing protein [Cellvibrio sp.]